MPNIDKDTVSSARKTAAQKAAPSKGTTKKSTSTSAIKSTRDKTSAVGKTEAVRSAPVTVTPEQRRLMIAEAAYYRAEKRGFAGNDTESDWLSAEAEVNRKLLQG